jgi:hypothetical protein
VRVEFELQLDSFMLHCDAKKLNLLMFDNILSICENVGTTQNDIG